MSTPSEFLQDEELATLTGYSLPGKQIAWLESHGWKFEKTGANRPVVGRVYARLKLAGVKPTQEAAQAWSLDLSQVS